jgi:hypothetical protein
MSKPSLIIDETINAVLENQEYIQPAIQTNNFSLLSQINLFYCITDELITTFYDLECQRRGTINFRETLPVNWDLQNYTEQ